MRLGIVLTLNQSLLTYNLDFLGQQQAHIHAMSIKLPLQHLKNTPHTQHLIRLILHQWQQWQQWHTHICHKGPEHALCCRSHQPVCTPALSSVPVAAEISALFESALHISGTLPFPVPDVFYESQRRQDGDMKHYLAPVSQSAQYCSALEFTMYLPRASLLEQRWYKQVCF